MKDAEGACTTAGANPESAEALRASRRFGWFNRNKRREALSSAERA